MNLAINGIFDFLFAFFTSLLLLPLTYKTLKKLKAKQSILHYVDMHSQKEGTPTMGGVSFVVGLCISVLLLSFGNFLPIVVCLGVTLLNALVGFYDDIKKVKFKHNEGLKPWQKLILQLTIFLLFSIYLYHQGLTIIIIPFVKMTIDVGFWIVPLCIFIGLFFTNCTNLADGLDGLESFIGSVVSCCLGVILLLISHMEVYDFVKNGELIQNLGNFSLMLSGAVFSFIFYNSYPAKIFMGDTGSLTIGGALVAIAFASGSVLYLLLIGLPFVITGLSVIIQVAYYKLTKKRIFLMAPLHHHFEKKGYHESKIVSLYFMATLIFSLLIILLELII